MSIEHDQAVHDALRAFAILEDDAHEVRHWVNNCDSIDALEAFFEVCGESELQLAYAIHLIEERLTALK